eukprot:Rmarinus@m.8588
MHGRLFFSGTRRINDLEPFSVTDREELAKACRIWDGTVLSRALSKDTTEKLLIGFGGCVQVETVKIPSSYGVTVCVSSQAGCSLSCRFCRTGTQKLERNLTAAEIVSQVYAFMHDEKILSPPQRQESNSDTSESTPDLDATTNTHQHVHSGQHKSRRKSVSPRDVAAAGGRDEKGGNLRATRRLGRRNGDQGKGSPVEG